MEMWLCRITTQTTKTFIQYVLFTSTLTLQPITWPYHMTLVQTFFISFKNRYLVVTESKLNDLLWNGKRKYIVFCVVWVVLFILNSSILSFVLHGCNINSILGNAIYAVMFGSVQALTLSLTTILYAVTLWKIYKVHKKTGCNMEEIDDNTRKHIRMKKRMVKSMKVVSFILITLVVSIIPSVVIGLKGVTSRLDILLIICFSVSNSVINPIIYCAQIDDLKKEIKTMFRIQT